MKIGNWEIRKVTPWAGAYVPSAYRINPELKRVFEIPETAPWWIAVHALIDELEAEWIKGARESVANTNVCINALGIQEGVASVRKRLIETRNEVLRTRQAA